MKLKFAAAFLCLILLLSFTGCDSSTAAPPEPSSAPSDPLPESTAPPASSQGTPADVSSQNEPVPGRIVQEATAKLAGTTILDVKSDYSYTFILTAEKKVYLYGRIRKN